MSYIGRLPIKIPEEVRVSISGNALVVRGPAGVEYSTPIDGITYKISADGSFLHVELADERWKPFWGMARTLASNLIIGVSRQFTLKLELVGVGYRVAIIEKDSVLELKLGFSHDILLDIPEGISVICPSNTNITLTGNNKDLLAKFAFKIKSFRPPEPYKGKGIKFLDEDIRRKEGKKK